MGNIFHKWKQRSRVGIYVGQLPQHARNVALVLDRQTGYVNPQFHVTFEPSFHTVTDNQDDSLWQLKAGFISQREPEPPMIAVELLQEPEQKRAHFQVSPAPKGAPDRTKKKQKQTTTNKRKELTNTQAPMPIQQSIGAPNPQLQLPLQRETEPDPKATDQTNHAGWNGKANQSSASLKQ
jgi:hypothetical protein